MRAGAAKAGAVAFPVFLPVHRSHLGNEQTGVLKDPFRQQPRVVGCVLGGRQRFERARILERKSERQRRLALAERARDAVGVVGRVGSDADVIERPGSGGRSRPRRHTRLALPDASDGAQRRIAMIRIEIENRLEQHERHAVESDRVVAEPAPGKPGILPAAEPVLRGADRIGIVQIPVDGALAFHDFRRPVGDDLSIDPRDDLVARVVLQRSDEPCLGPFRGSHVLRFLRCSTAPARAHRDANRGDATEHAIP